jgi:serine/threonine protein kinase
MTASQAVALAAKLRFMLTPTTRRRFSTVSPYVLDGPLQGATGQSGVDVVHVFRGSRLLCAKTSSSPSSLKREHAVSSAVHAAWIAPTVLQTIDFVGITRSIDNESKATGALIMPLYPMVASWASVALDDGPHATRVAFTANAAVCLLSAVKAMSLAGYTHGDIKPNNLLVDASSERLILCDFGTARKCGESFLESSAFNLGIERRACVGYDVVCMGATLAALLDKEFVVSDGMTCDQLASSFWGRYSADDPASLLAQFIAQCVERPFETLVCGSLDLLGDTLDHVLTQLRSSLGQQLAVTLLTRDSVWPRQRPNNE